MYFKMLSNFGIMNTTIQKGTAIIPIAKGYETDNARIIEENLHALHCCHFIRRAVCD
ncbi:hypothetical protein MASR2M70_05810 [Bacillota bacterium]